MTMVIYEDTAIEEFKPAAYEIAHPTPGEMAISLDMQRYYMSSRAEEGKGRPSRVV